MEKYLDIVIANKFCQSLGSSLYRGSTIIASHHTNNPDIYLSAAQEKNDGPEILNIYEGKPLTTVGKSNG